MTEIPLDDLPNVVLVMDSEGVVRLFGWPKDGILVNRTTMEQFLTFLVSCDCLTVRGDGEGLVQEGPGDDDEPA